MLAMPLISSQHLGRGAAMIDEIFENPEDLAIVGTSVRTSAQAAASDIPAAWKRFIREEVLPSARARHVIAAWLR
jgi:hypothetical protein